MIVLLAGGFYLWLFGVQTYFALYSRKIGREIPIVNSVPVKLQDISVSKEQGERLSFNGITFEVPWNDVDETKSRVVGTWALIFFRSGNSILLCVTKPKDFMNDMFRDNIAKPELFTALYGPEVLDSDYALKKAIFETTPSKITLLMSAHNAAGFGSILLMKAIMPPTTDWAIYNINADVLKGFQLGDPERRPKKMSLELYANEAEFEVNINQVQSESVPAITQADINRIIQSSHTIPNAQPVLTVTHG